MKELIEKQNTLDMQKSYLSELDTKINKLENNDELKRFQRIKGEYDKAQVEWGKIEKKI